MITLGFSPCPNDTFIFCAIANRMIDTSGLDFELHIEDVETLNTLAVNRSLDVTKISCNAFRYLRDDYCFLNSGGALGRGCGPLIVSKDPGVFPGRRQAGLKIAIPGRLTTAALLLELYIASSFNGFSPELVIMPFHRIMQSVTDGEADAGLIIHESRFTYQNFGLVKIADLGEWWEQETGLPIPLGGIAAKKSLGEETIIKIENLIRASINYSLSHKEAVMPFISGYAREMDEAVMLKHIGLYVNEFTLDIGKEGLEALEELLRRSASLVL